MTLVARKGDELVRDGLRAAGAARRWRRSRSSRGEGFGEGIADGRGGRVATGPAVSAASAVRQSRAGALGAPRAGHAAARHLRASAGIALGPVRRFEEQLETPPERPSQGPRWSGSRLESAREARQVGDRARSRSGGTSQQRRAMPRSSPRTWRCSTTRRWSDAARGSESRPAPPLRPRGTTRARRRPPPGGRSTTSCCESAPRMSRTSGAACWRRWPDASRRPSLQGAGVLVVSELTPADAAALDPELVRGHRRGARYRDRPCRDPRSRAGDPGCRRARPLGAGDRRRHAGAARRRRWARAGRAERGGGRAGAPRCANWRVERRAIARRHAGEPAVTRDGTSNRGVGQSRRSRRARPRPWSSARTASGCCGPSSCSSTVPRSPRRRSRRRRSRRSPGSSTAAP